MKHWPTKPLGEIIEISRERIEPAEHPDTLFNYVGLESIEGHTGRLLPYQPTPGAEIKSTKNVFHPGELLYGKLRPYLNKVHLVGMEGICSTDIYVLRPRQRQVHPSFVATYLRSPSVLAVVSNAMAGANLPRVGQDVLFAIPIPVPPLGEQERIVKLLDEADDLQKLRAQADRRMSTMIPALFNELVGNHDDFPTATVAELAEQREGSIRTGPFGSDLRHSEFVEDGIPVLGIDNVVENEFRWTKPRCVTPTKFETMRRFVVFPGDVLVTIMGTVGRCVVAPADLPVCVSTKHLCAVTVDRKRIDPHYLWGAFLFDERVRRQTQTVGQGAIMEGWNSTIIKQLSVRVPPLPLQREFAQRVAEIRAMEVAQAASHRRLEALVQSLLHLAFSGGL
jgi:type I restriction enzyme S subunit